jgi:hypothetical protein
LANQANATTWTLNSQPNGTAAPSACPAPSNGGFHAPSSFPQSFPQWTHVALPTDKQPCH